VKTFHDLDELAGRWSEPEARAFSLAVAPFSQIDAALWAAEPKTAYRVKRRAGRRPPR